MSIKVKLQILKNEILAELEKKDKELLRLKDDVRYFIEQARKEISSETEKINNGLRLLSNEKKRFENQKIKTEQEIEKHRIKTEKEIESERKDVEKRIDRHIDDVIEYFEELGEYGKDPKLIDAYINACYILDGKLAKYFTQKVRPNPNASEIISRYKKENRNYLQRIMELEYQISEFWAKDIDTSEKEDFEYLDDDEDRAKSFLSLSDYSLSEIERNQKALDNYWKRKHSKSYIGKMYERYIGYLYEQEGYKVEYRGIELGLKDGGIDLVCSKRGEMLLVQCKNWKQDSIIYEKHICQLYGATKFYDKVSVKREFGETLFSNIEWQNVIPVFVSTTQLDEHAVVVANALGVNIRNEPFEKKYPIIKCNINSNGEKIYHMPFDQMYDYTKISKVGERWASTVQEAENDGFRRAKRHFVQRGSN